MNYYGVFLMIELAKLKKLINPDLAYDLMWEKGIALYKEFLASSFDDGDKGEYDCIHSFLLSKSEERLTKAVKNLEDRGVEAKIQYGTVYVCVDDVELELSSGEVDYNAKEYDEKEWGDDD